MILSTSGYISLRWIYNNLLIPLNAVEAQITCYENKL